MWRFQCIVIMSTLLFFHDCDARWWLSLWSYPWICPSIHVFRAVKVPLGWHLMCSTKAECYYSHSCVQTDFRGWLLGSELRLSNFPECYEIRVCVPQEHNASAWQHFEAFEVHFQIARKIHPHISITSTCACTRILHSTRDFFWGIISFHTMSSCRGKSWNQGITNLKTRTNHAAQLCTSVCHSGTRKANIVYELRNQSSNSWTVRNTTVTHEHTPHSIAIHKNKMGTAATSSKFTMQCHTHGDSRSLIYIEKGLFLCVPTINSEANSACSAVCRPLVAQVCIGEELSVGSTFLLIFQPWVFLPPCGTCLLERWAFAFGFYFTLGSIMSQKGQKPEKHSVLYSWVSLWVSSESSVC